MGVPTSEVGYTSATTRRGDHESSYEHVVALGRKILLQGNEPPYYVRPEHSPITILHYAPRSLTQ